jgi:signal transduction histidine kinase
MQSTRSLLILYFLLLTGLSLGAIGLLADRIISRTLDQQSEAQADSLDLRTERAIQVVRDQFDAELNHDARLIAQSATKGKYQDEVAAEMQRFPLLTLQMPLMGSIGPRQALFAPLWQGTLNSALSRRTSILLGSLQRDYIRNLNLDRKFLEQLDEEDRIHEFIQMDSSRGSTRRSQNLKDSGYTLPFDRKRYEALLDDTFYENVPLPNGQTGRRVILKTPIPYITTSQSRFSPPPARPGVGRPLTTPRPPAVELPPLPPPDPLPSIYIHVAKSDQEMREKITEIERKARDEKDYQLAVNQQTKRLYRLGLGSGTLLAFLASLLGSSWLIRRGLRPLNHLSDAVSQVSERDFRLPMNPKELTTELRPIHARITETLDQLKGAFDREKQAVADISHELRTPVASLLATIDVSLRKPRTAEQYHATLKECRGITKQLGQLVEKVMTLAYLDAGQTRMSMIEIDVTEIVASCAAVIRPLAEAHGLSFRMTPSEPREPLELRTDPDRLREILVNLLHNAIEYNRPGGSIELVVESCDDNVEFTVRDSGIGMTPDVSDHIFERFYRADPSRTATGVHAGLGLAIVKEYVNRLGGRVTVESEPGIGSVFRVKLPRRVDRSLDAL